MIITYFMVHLEVLEIADKLSTPSSVEKTPENIPFQKDETLEKGMLKKNGVFCWISMKMVEFKIDFWNT